VISPHGEGLVRRRQKAQSREIAAKITTVVGGQAGSLVCGMSPHEKIGDHVAARSSFPAVSFEDLPCQESSLGLNGVVSDPECLQCGRQFGDRSEEWSDFRKDNVTDNQIRLPPCRHEQVHPTPGVVFTLEDTPKH